MRYKTGKENESGKWEGSSKFLGQLVSAKDVATV